MPDIHAFEPIWPNWVVDEVIGRGSFGTVWKAHREDAYARISQNAAVKHISIPNDTAVEEMAGISISTARKYYRGQLDQLVREIEAMIGLRGAPHIVSYEEHRIIEKPEGSGFDLFLRMELLTSLPSHISKSKAIGRDEVIRLGIHIARALEILQGRDFIHRDIKPQNVFVDAYGNYKLGDFGTARALQGAGYASTRAGTPNYMAPEVYNGNASYDQTVDIYSLGIMLYRYMNRGFLPFINDQEMNPETALMKRVQGVPLPPPGAADPGLSGVILKACAHLPEDRYQSARDLRMALEGLNRARRVGGTVVVNCLLSGSNRVLQSRVEILGAGLGNRIQAPALDGYELIGDSSVAVPPGEGGDGVPRHVTFVYQVEKTIISHRDARPGPRDEQPGEGRQSQTDARPGPKDEQPGEGGQAQTDARPGPRDEQPGEGGQSQTDAPAAEEGGQTSQKPDVEEFEGPVLVPVICETTDGILLSRDMVPCSPGGETRIPAPGQPGYALVGSDSVSVYVSDDGKAEPPQALFLWKKKKPVHIITALVGLAVLLLSVFGLVKLFSLPPAPPPKPKATATATAPSLAAATAPIATAPAATAPAATAPAATAPAATAPAATAPAATAPEAAKPLLPGFQSLRSEIGFLKYAQGKAYSIQTQDVYLGSLGQGEAYYLGIEVSNQGEQEMVFDLSCSLDGAPAFQVAAVALTARVRQAYYLDEALAVGAHQATWYANGEAIGSFTGQVLEGSSPAPASAAAAASTNPEGTSEDWETREPVETNASEDIGTNTMYYHVYEDGDGRYASILHYDFEQADLKIPEYLGGLPVKGIEAEAFLNHRQESPLHIPAGIRWIKGNPFHSSLSFTLDGNNPWFALVNGLLIEKAANRAVALSSSHKGLEEYTIPQGILSIEARAFEKAEMKSVYLPEGLTGIGDHAFSWCANLASIRIPDSVIALGDSVLQFCSSLKSLEIPANVQYIGSQPFSAYSLRELTIAPGNPYFEVKNSFLIDIQGKRAIQLLDESLSEAVIPDGIVIIGERAVGSWNQLRSVKLPNTLREIGDSAFSFSLSLTSIRIPKGVTRIGHSAFDSCGSLKSVQLPESLVSLGWSAFSNCPSLTSVKIPNGVLEIDSSVFSGCKSLKTVQLPKGVTKIGFNAFSGCESLGAIRFPGSLEEVADWAFQECSSLESIVIPEKVASIGFYAFGSCTALKTVKVLNEKAVIEADAFENCPKLTLMGAPGSTAEAHAASRGIPFKEL